MQLLYELEFKEKTRQNHFDSNFVFFSYVHREFLFHMSTPIVSNTNPKCILKTNVVCDRSDPTIVFDFIPKVCGKNHIFHNISIEIRSFMRLFVVLFYTEENQLKSVKIHSANLTTLELLQLLNKHVTPLAPVEEQVRVITTKAGKRK